MNVRPTRVAPAPTDTTFTVAETGKLPATGQNSMGMTEVRNTAPPAAAYPPVLAKAILAVTGNINPVAKSGWNEFHKYAYRRFEDVFEELVPLLVSNGLIIEQSEIARGGLESDLIFITYQFTIIHADGHVWPNRPELTAICKIRDQKGVLDDKAASKCNTQAQKYFYTSFFKIRSVDTTEADHDGGGRPSKAPARRAPAPDGKVAPHMIAIIQDEAPEAWGKRFKEKIEKSSTKEEIDLWYDTNAKVFEKLASKKEYELVYNDLIDHMDAREATLNGGQKSEPKPDALNAEEWLESLGNAFSACEDALSIAGEQERLMIPMKDKVHAAVWKQALVLVDTNLKRISG